MPTAPSAGEPPHLLQCGLAGEGTTTFKCLHEVVHSPFEVLGVLQESSAELLLVLLQHAITVHQTLPEGREDVRQTGELVQHLTVTRVGGRREGGSVDNQQLLSNPKLLPEDQPPQIQ